MVRNGFLPNGISRASQGCGGARPSSADDALIGSDRLRFRRAELLNCLTQRSKGRKGRKGAKELPWGQSVRSTSAVPKDVLCAFATFAPLRQAVRSFYELHLEPVKPDLDAADARVQDLGGRRLQRLHV